MHEQATSMQTANGPYVLAHIASAALRTEVTVDSRLKTIFFSFRRDAMLFFLFTWCDNLPRVNGEEFKTSS